jgi:hypothetical protein
MCTPLITLMTRKYVINKNEMIRKYVMSKYQKVCDKVCESESM